MTRAEAKIIIDKVIAHLKPYIVRGDVCGSWRRGKEELSDIDIVLIPQIIELKDMFDNVTGTTPVQGFIDTINSWEKIRGQPEGRYCQRVIDGQKVEIAIAQEDNYGCLKIIRTGNKEFSHHLMIRANKYGYEQRDGFLHNGDKVIPIREEIDYFNVLNLPYIHPSERDEHALRKLRPK